jgi:hypothetical protein
MSDDNKLFKVAGVSCGVTGFKVRFANDMTRVKVLMKSGNSDIELIELPHEMSKSQAVEFLKGSQLMERAEYREAIEAADAKYCAATTVKVSKPASVKVAKQKKSAPSIEDIRARARASSAPADMLGEAIAALVAESQRNPVTE